MGQVDIPDFIGGARRRTRTYDVGDDNTLNILAAIVDLITPAGTYIATALAAEPAGDVWKLCNGQALLKTSYPRLYAIFGGTFGEDTLTFNLPDLEGRLVIGAGTAVALSALAGSADVTLTTGQLPAHSHTVTDPGHGHAVTDPGHVHAADRANATNDAAAGSAVKSAKPGDTDSATTGISVGSATTGISIDNTGSGQAIDITPPVIGINWLVRS